jgi:hypothetical protein
VRSERDWSLVIGHWSPLPKRTVGCENRGGFIKKNIKKKNTTKKKKCPTCGGFINKPLKKLPEPLLVKPPQVGQPTVHDAPPIIVSGRRSPGHERLRC